MKTNLVEMKNFLFVLILGFVFSVDAQNDFKSTQQRFANVKTAYKDKELLITNLLAEHLLLLSEIEIHIRVFKSEKQLELWVKKKTSDKFVKLKQFKICFSSGILGPKRYKHDLQVPEGFYEVNSFNPTSYNYLSLGINYPNKSDRILGEQGNLGGSIAVHGGCVSVGCVPISDDLMKELYVVSVEARNNGQKSIPVRIFPCHLNQENYEALIVDTLAQPDLGLWEDLKNEYAYFERYKEVKKFRVLQNGRHQFVFD